MTMENPPFEDVFPIEHGNLSNVMLVFQGRNFWGKHPCLWLVIPTFVNCGSTPLRFPSFTIASNAGRLSAHDGFRPQRFVGSTPIFQTKSIKREIHQQDQQTSKIRNSCVFFSRFEGNLMFPEKTPVGLTCK